MYRTYSFTPFRLSGLPFFIVLFATFLPWIAAWFNSRLVSLLPDLVVIGCTLALVGLKPHLYSYTKPAWFLLIFVIFHTLGSVLMGKGVPSGGILSLVIMTLLFSKLLLLHPTRGWEEWIYELVGFIYKCHLIFLASELLFRISGFTDILVDIAGNATEVAKYKTYNSAEFLWWLGFSQDQITGLNSLLLGSQSASQLSVFSTIWFAPLFRGTDRISYGSSGWFFFSLIMVPVTSSMTASLILTLVILALVFIIPNNLLNRTWLRISIISIAITVGQYLLTIIFYRILSEADFYVYWDTFSATPSRFLELGIVDKLIGYGAAAQFLDVESSDFGLGALLIQIGAIFFLLLCISLVWLITSQFKFIRRLRSLNGPLRALATKNLLIFSGWAFSLIHYTPAIELGGRQLFALHLAVALASISLARKALRKNSKLVPTTCANKI